MLFGGMSCIIGKEITIKGEGLTYEGRMFDM